jgi:glycosyltransferase involved in cell wall biosynthesis
MGKALTSNIPSVKGLIDILTSLKGKDISDLSRKARAWAEEKFSWSVLKDQWIDILSRR